MSQQVQQANPVFKSILVRGVNWLGDAVMTTPALQRLRERFPEAKITLLTPEKLVDLWLHHPSVDEMIPFKPGESVLRVASRIRGWKFMKTAAEFQKGRLKGEHRNVDEATVRALQFFSLLSDFKAIPFDVALIFPNSPRSALEAWLARIPRRVGYTRRWRNKFLTDRVPTRPGHLEMRKRSRQEIGKLVSDTTLVAPKSDASGSRITHDASGPTAHHIYQYLHLAQFLGANPAPVPPRLEVTAPEIQSAEDVLLTEAKAQWKDVSAAKPLWLALNPSAAYGPAKRWPAARFAAVARQTCDRFPNAIWIAIGGPDDAAVCNEVIGLAKTRILNRAGQGTLRDLMAVLKLSRVLLTNDSGPMHVAAALGTPVVVPFGSTSAALTGPGLPGENQHHLYSAQASCSPCFLRECPIDFRCMTGISVDEVLNGVVGAVSAAAVAACSEQ
jgi:lipopolysaccharide heptosyltransferase II